jgi:preprotein translocase subunit SecA
MVIHAKDMVQGELNFGIVDECDSILIDEARTPLIISGTSNEDTAMYTRVDAVIRRLTGKDITGEDKPKDIFEQAFQKKYDDESGKDWDYEYDRKHHHASLTPRGINKVEKALEDVLVLDPNDDNPTEKNLFSYANTEVAHYVQQSLRAHGLYEVDVQYVVKDGEVIIVDEFTGRLMFGRRYSEGLHQAIEAKEGLDVAPESQTLATITIQNYFRQYHKLAGMTGTAKTEEEEFKKIYGMDVVVVPTNKAVTRKDVADVVYKSEKGKFNAIADDVAERHKTGQPVLVGTVSIEKSERLAALMQKKGVPCKVLNAKYHEQEAYIVAQAGRPGTVTVATNMAGRGTDIILGGNPEFAAREELRGMGLDPEEHDEEFRALVNKLKPEYEAMKQQVLHAGGLYVLGSERHESRRIDNQLRGRSGRQGDPGESRFFLSLQDDLMRMYGGERVEKLMELLKIDEDTPIESGLLTRSIENAQKKVEGRNFDIRKHTLQYDDVMNKQRQVIYGERRRILEGGSLKEAVSGYIDNAVKKVVEESTVRHGREWTVDYEGLIQAARGNFPIGELTLEDIEGKSPDEITEMFQRKVHNLYDQKELEIGRAVIMRMNPESAPEQVEAGAREVGAQHMREIERVVTLKSIDENWIEHLNMLDHLRSGVSLRGYGQQDPVVVYAQEAFAAFDTLKQDIQLDVIRKMFLVRIEAPVVERKSAYNIQAQGKPGTAGGGPVTPGGTTESGQRIAVKAGPKLGRNAKCYCGSGKKYKQCHLPLDGGEAPDNWPELYEKAYGESAPVG